MKISVVLSIVRSAIGTQQIPPTQVITGMAIILTVYIMTPVGLEIYKVTESSIQQRRPGASLVSAEDKGEETTDQIGVPDATRVYRYGEEPPPYEPVPLNGQVLWLLYSLTAWGVLAVLWWIF